MGKGARPGSRDLGLSKNHLMVALMLCCVRLSVVCVTYALWLNGATYRANDSLVVCEESTGTKMNDLDLCIMHTGRLRSYQTIVSVHSPLNISETVGDRGLVPEDHR